SQSKRAAQIFAADGYGIQLRRQCIQHLACPVTQMIILQMKDDCSPISKLAQCYDPLRTVVDMHNSELMQSSDKRPKPHNIFVAADQRDMLHQHAYIPSPTGLMWNGILILIRAGESENLHPQVVS